MRFYKLLIQCVALLVGYLCIVPLYAATPAAGAPLKIKVRPASSPLCPEEPCGNEDDFNKLFEMYISVSDYGFNGTSFEEVTRLPDPVTITGRKDSKVLVCSGGYCDLIDMRRTFEQIAMQLYVPGVINMKTAQLIATKIKNTKSRDVRCNTTDIKPENRGVTSAADDLQRWYVARDIFDAYKQRNELADLISVSNTGAAIVLIDGIVQPSFRVTLIDGGTDDWPVRLSEQMNSMQLTDVPYNHVAGSPANSTACPYPD